MIVLREQVSCIECALLKNIEQKLERGNKYIKLRLNNWTSFTVTQSKFSENKVNEKIIYY